MLKERRSMRTPVILGVVAAVGFGAFMVVNFGNRQRDEGLSVDGPVYSGKTMSSRKLDEQPAPPPAGGTARSHNAAEAGPPASVEVVVGVKDVMLWVDGRQVGSGAKHTLSLAPGKHVLMFQQKERTVMQKLTLDAGDVYRVDMHDKVTFTKLR